jgi:hypothetical protein
VSKRCGLFMGVCSKKEETAEEEEERAAYPK